MKTTLRLLSLAALACAFALPAFAQDAAAAAQGPCTEQARTDLYTKYYELKGKKDAKGQPDPAAQKQAYDVAKEYAGKYAASCPDQYTTAVQKFIAAYDKAVLEVDFLKAFNDKRWADAISLGKQIQATRPDDVKTALLMSWAGYNFAILPANKDNTTARAEAISLVQRAAQLLESGKTADSYVPYTDRDAAQSFLIYELGALNLKDNPDEAVKHLVKVAQGNSAAKQEPTTYSYLAYAYEKEYAKAYEDYQKKYTVESDESRVALANINLIVDRVIDAYARAIAYTKGETADKAAWKQKVTELYKSRHEGSDAGLAEMLATITTKPLLITTPVTSVPAAPAATNGDGTTKPPTDATGKPATDPTTAAKPAQTTAKPRPPARP
ncbi:MAG TPA: hypothetical protein VF546_19820 [Pyrinomonadaceae bacterium]|jgi:hypothetical protein